MTTPDRELGSAEVSEILALAVPFVGEATTLRSSAGAPGDDLAETIRVVAEVESRLHWHGDPERSTYGLQLAALSALGHTARALRDIAQSYDAAVAHISAHAVGCARHLACPPDCPNRSADPMHKDCYD